LINELAPLVSHYGLWVIFFGMMVEGTTVIIATGVICYMGLLSLNQAILVAIAGAIIGDWFWYVIGRNYAEALINRFPSVLHKIESLKGKVISKGAMLAFAERFIYGGAFIFPITLGFYKYPFKKFAMFEVIGTSLWAIVGILLGHLLGKSAEYLFGEIKEIEHLLLVIAIIAIAIWYLRRKYLNNKD